MALAIALEPLPISGYILLLASEGGSRKGLGFLVGWLVTLVGVVALTVALTGGEPLKTSSAPSTAALVARIALGAVLLVLAWHQHRTTGRPRKEPKWQQGLDRLGFASAMLLGFLLQPWTLVAMGAANITSADTGHAATWVTLTVFVLLSSGSFLAMQLYVWRSPVAARARLDSLRTWLDGHRDFLIVVIALVVGLWLIGQSAYLLASA